MKPKKEWPPLPGRPPTFTSAEASTAAYRTPQPTAATERRDSTCWCRTPEPPAVAKRLDAWRATIEHLAAAGYPAAVPADTLAALCARGGLDRAIAHTAEAVTA